MAFAPAEWLRETKATYVGNATAVRDFRVQLRGTRAILLWALYLVVLIGFGMITYSVAADRGTMSIASAQSSLYTFYRSVMYLLTTVVMLVAPALTATAIVSERQRQSLDLVFSAPVTPKYYLVGKMISSYRYIWMLLVLSLPVTSACIVLGGAVWSEVLIAYALLSLHGLVFTSIAVLFSCLAQKPVGAVVWSYIAVFAYTALVTMFSFTVMATATYGFSTRGQGMTEMPFPIALSPYLNVEAAPTFTLVGTTHIGNWLLTGVVLLLLVKFFLVAAGSALSHYGSAETKSLRIHSLFYMFLLSGGVTWALAKAWVMAGAAIASGAASGGPSSIVATTPPGAYAGRLVVATLLPLIIVIPFVTCFGNNLERKFWHDGIFNVKKLLTGSPSGGLPFLLSLVAATSAGCLIGSKIAGAALDTPFLMYVFYAAALIVACWSVGRLTSATATNLRQARTLQFTVMLLILVLPAPLLLMADPFSYAEQHFTVWDLYLLRPLYSTGDRSGLAVFWGAVLLVLGFAFAAAGETLAKKNSLEGLAHA